jgi:hypothetical protein
LGLRLASNRSTRLQPEENAMHRLLFTVAAAVALLPAVAAANDSCAVREARNLDLDAKGANLFKLETGAGDLTVEGVPGLDHIEVRGKACASTPERMAAMSLEHSQQAGTISVATKIPEIEGGWNFFGRDDYAYIDLEIRMPAQLLLDLKDSSGDIDIRRIAGGLRLVDSSGDIKLRDIGGDVTITDTSGDIEADGVDGNLTVLSDSSGDIELAHVKGDAVVHEDSSGDISFEHVAGSARVDKDSSGDIDFRDIGRDASVGSDSSGDVHANEVKGNFTVTAKPARGGEITYREIGGKVSLPPEG